MHTLPYYCSAPEGRSDTQSGRVLDDQMCREQESSLATSSKTPLGRYSSTGPEYEPIQTSNMNQGGNQSINRNHPIVVADGKITFRPASYEIPISSDIMTLNAR